MMERVYLPEIETIFSEVIDSMNTVVILADDDGTILYCNELTRETFGELMGHNKDFIFKNTSLSKDGEKLPDEGSRDVLIADVAYYVIWSTVKGEDGKIYHAYILEDISERISARNQLEDSVKKIQQESDIAKNIQTSILPLDGEYDGAVRISSLYLPADDLGGDVYGIVKVSATETLFYIADVSGHGIQASLLTMYLRERIRSDGRSAAKGLDVLIGEVLQDFVSLDIDASIYATALFCSYDKVNHELRVANAGHNCLPLVIRDGGRAEEIQVRGMPISKISHLVGSVPEEEVIGLSPGDRVILYTDGLIEEYSKVERSVFGSAGVRRVAVANHGLDGKSLAKLIINEAGKYAMVQASDDRAILIADIIG
jgi:sigma-B regulation protein RsbU (phosphoserine phosphatase)